MKEIEGKTLEEREKIRVGLIYERVEAVLIILFIVGALSGTIFLSLKYLVFK